MFCNNCGNQVAENSKFCGKCGAKINRSSTEVVLETELPIEKEIPEIIITDYAENVQQDIVDVQAMPTENIIIPPVVEPASAVPLDNIKTVTRTEKDTKEILSTADYIIMLIVTLIPLVNIVYLLYMAFFQKKSKNRKSFARAVIILACASAVISLLFFASFLLTSILMIG